LTNPAIPGPLFDPRRLRRENVSYGYPGSDAMVLRDLNLASSDENVASVRTGPENDARRYWRRPVRRITTALTSATSN
jgi:hypothetical protein